MSLPPPLRPLPLPQPLQRLLEFLRARLHLRLGHEALRRRVDQLGEALRGRVDLGFRVFALQELRHALVAVEARDVPGELEE